jgi:hypothetical protein
MLAHGFAIPQMVELVHARRATAATKRVVSCRRSDEITRVRTTDVGRRALEPSISLLT